MKSEHQFFEELSIPCHYEDAVNEVHALKVRALAQGVYFKNPLYEYVSPSGMKLHIDGKDLPLLTQNGIMEAIQRLTNSQRITDDKEILSIIRDLKDRNMATYWYVLYKFAAQAFVIRAGDYINIYAVLGKTGVSHSIHAPVYKAPEPYVESSDDDDDDDSDY